MKKSFATVNILNIPFINTSFAQFMATIQARILAHQSTFVVTANPEIVMAARTDQDYLTTVQGADYVTPDGVGILRAAATLGQPMPERITGFDTMVALLEWGSQTHQSAYFLGAKPAVAARMKTVLAARYPGLEVAGVHDGYFDDDTAINEALTATNPAMVFVALGYPKQEQFIQTHRHLTQSFWMGVGGSFDVLTGAVKRAPSFWQKHHLEWFYRTVTDPKRLKRIAIIPRYLQLVRQQRKRQASLKS